MPKSLRQRLSEARASTLKAEHALASYILAELATLPFETATSLAATVLVSEPTVRRFCRSIEYASVKDLNAHMRRDMGDQPWLISDRLSDLQAHHQAGDDKLVCGLELEMAAVVTVCEVARSV